MGLLIVSLFLSVLGKCHVNTTMCINLSASEVGNMYSILHFIAACQHKSYKQFFSLFTHLSLNILNVAPDS